MNCLFIRLSIVFAVCLAEVSGISVKRIPLNSRYADYNVYTYFTNASILLYQTNLFENEGSTIGSLYEDESSSNTNQCPKLTRIYLSTQENSGRIVYERIVDSELANSTELNASVPLGYVAPYPGYCSSDDALPIIELYSENLAQFLYWSPANPSQYVKLIGVCPDTTRFKPVRLVGYALNESSDTLTLENSAPDFVKPVAKGSYSHSFYPMQDVVAASKSGKNGFAANPDDVDALVGPDEYSYNSSTGFFSLAKVSAGNVAALDEVCGKRATLYSFVNTTDSISMRIYLRTEASVAAKSGYKARSSMGDVFLQNKAVCGGIKGLTKIVELRKDGQYAYSIDSELISSMTKNGWEAVTDHNLGYVPIDYTGFLLINQHIDFPYPFAEL